jgi:hypothetical protein
MEDKYDLNTKEGSLEMLRFCNRDPNGVNPVLPVKFCGDDDFIMDWIVENGRFSTRCSEIKIAWDVCVTDAFFILGVTEKISKHEETTKEHNTCAYILEVVRRIILSSTKSLNFVYLGIVQTWCLNRSYGFGACGNLTKFLSPDILEQVVLKYPKSILFMRERMSLKMLLHSIPHIEDEWNITRFFPPISIYTQANMKLILQEISKTRGKNVLVKMFNIDANRTVIFNPLNIYANWANEIGYEHWGDIEKYMFECIDIHPSAILTPHIKIDWTKSSCRIVLEKTVWRVPDLLNFLKPSSIDETLRIIAEKKFFSLWIKTELLGLVTFNDMSFQFL